MSKDILLLIISNGGALNAADKEGKTPIVHASILGNIDAVELLETAGGDPNIPDENGSVILIHRFSKYLYFTTGGMPLCLLHIWEVYELSIF